MLTETKTRIKHIILLLLTYAIYFLINKLSIPRFNFSSVLDAQIPFLPFFGLFYFSYFPFLIFTIVYAFFKFKLLKFQKLTVTLIIIQCVAYLFHILLPATLLRPSVLGNSIFEQLVQFIYWFDNPSNLTPSLHVANPCLISFFYSKKSWRHLLWLWAFLIIISTLIIKQHVVLDVVTGISLSCTTIAITKLFWSKEKWKNWKIGKNQ